jgi:hypothetical protein
VRLILPFAVLLAACGGSPGADQTTTPTSTPLSITTSAVPTTIEGPPPVECPPAPYELGYVPFGVGEPTLDTEAIEPDVWTSEGGTNTTFWARTDGTVAMALVRGDLPALEWPGEKGEIFVDGTRGAVGPHLDGTWVAGWAEQPGERCDEYSMIFYPPVAPAEVEETLAGMNRVGG